MIRRRLVIAVTLTVAVAIGSSAWFIVTALEQRLISDVDQQFISGSLDLGRDMPIPARNERNPIFDERRQVAIIQYGPDGEVEGAISSGSADDPDPLPDVTALTPDDGLSTVSSPDGPRYRAAAFPTRSGGVVVVAASLADVDATLSDARSIQLLVGALAIGVVAVTCWLLIRQAFAPIDGMIVTAGRIADDNLAERTTVDDPRSEVGRLAGALNTMLDRLQTAVATSTESEARMRRFVDDASHDLRTPLTSVRGYAELYRAGADDPASVARSMERISAEADRMSRLVDDLMSLARIDQGRSVSVGAIDLGRIAGEAVDAARVIDHARTYDFDTVGRLDLTGDPDRLRQVFDNLLTNVRLHTPPATTATVTVTGDDGGITVDLSDDGPGLGPDDRRRAFDRFWRSTRADENPIAGSGLGLSIVQGIVEAHHGTVALDASPSGGVWFRIHLPRSLEASPLSGPPRSGPSTGTPA